VASEDDKSGDTQLQDARSWEANGTKHVVSCYHVRKLLQWANISRVDLLSVHIEGSEMSLLRQFPWSAVPAEIVLIEAQYNAAEIEAVMVSHGYCQIARIGQDDVYLTSATAGDRCVEKAPGRRLEMESFSRALSSQQASDHHPPGVAVLVDVRMHPRLPVVMKNFRELLPHSWPIHFVHGLGSEKEVAESAMLQPAIKSGALVMRPLHTVAPRDVAKAACESLGFRGRARRGGLAPWNVRAWYNFLLMSPQFWYAFSDFRSVLLFEADTALCPHPTHSLLSFTKYFMVGPPFLGCYNPDAGKVDSFATPGCVGNSGLSLWNVSSIRKTLESKSAPLINFGQPPIWPEAPRDLVRIPIVDMWFSDWAGQPNNSLDIHAVTGMPQRDTMPAPSVAAHFGVSLAFAGNFTPFGVHNPKQHISGMSAQRREELFARCPLARNTSYRWHPVSGDTQKQLCQVWGNTYGA